MPNGTTPIWLPFVSFLINSGLLVTGFFVIRRLSQLELKVELMWRSFERRKGNIQVIHRYDKDEDQDNGE